MIDGILFHFASPWCLAGWTLFIFIAPLPLFHFELPFGVCDQTWGKLDFILFNTFLTTCFFFFFGNLCCCPLLPHSLPYQQFWSIFWVSPLYFSHAWLLFHFFSIVIGWRPRGKRKKKTTFRLRSFFTHTSSSVQRPSSLSLPGKFLFILQKPVLIYLPNYSHK